MKVTFDNLNIRSDSVRFFNDVNNIILDFETNEVHFIGNDSTSHTFFFDYHYGGGVSHHEFRVPDPSGEGSVCIVIEDNGTFSVQDFLPHIPGWIRAKCENLCENL